ncbi:hypothetical protein GJ744_007814 [Endocarpon pusillum]|uniref:Uncharacterized protein n=1 Tax=Endocarpon pusillum TaxID=364733 RepID=A0A8H7EA05_9EURO|nr:hypothetical protein GJ744_007814 [Endocarpon pusillum]
MLLSDMGFKTLTAAEDSLAINGTDRLASIPTRQRRRVIRIKIQVGHENLIQGRSALRNFAAPATGRQHRMDDVSVELCNRRQALIHSVSAP